MEKEDIIPLKLSPEEESNNGKIISRLYKAKISRDTNHKEFNGQSYIDWFNNNEIIANTEITRDQTNKGLAIHTGTIEQKLLVILAEINRLNLTGEVRVYDKEDQELQEFGMALTDICDKTAEMELDDEKKLIRDLELLKQGTVFVQDNWVKRWVKEKKLDKKFDGKIKGTTWEEKMVLAFNGPERDVLFGPGVYLGNIKEFDMKKQPYMFTLKSTSYEEAKSRFGKKDKDGKCMWERWEHVPKKKVSMLSEADLTNIAASGGWSLTDIENDTVEEIHYQDQFNDEYQIYLNGVPMLPAGFPLSAITPGGMYNIEKQVLQVINPFFAYGRSFPVKTEQLAKLLDEMIKLLIIKTRKSIHPPYANISGKVISEKSLMPGVISMGIDPNALVPIGTEGQGATSSEYQMLNKLTEAIDNITVSPQMQGVQGKTGQTAYEVEVLKQQAQKTIALFIFAASMLEKKVTWLRANYILANYFDPIGTELDEGRNMLKNKYRVTSKKTTLEGRGKGVRKIVPIDDVEGITPESIYEEEEYTGTPLPKEEGMQRKTRVQLGMDPLQIIYLNVKTLRDSKYTFFTEVISKPKDTSNTSKLMFREELRDIQVLMSMGSSPNLQALENEYALIWDKRKEKLFGKPQQMAQEAMGQGGAKALNENIPTNIPTEEGVDTMMAQ
jgi:hypothetical protein